jgi:Phage capsid family
MLAFDLLKNADNDPFTRPAGLPRILVSDQLPIAAGRADALVFSPSAALVVRRKDASLDVDRTGQYFQNDSAGIRVRMRADVVVGRPSGIVKITGLPAGDPLSPPAAPEEAGSTRAKSTK